MPGLDINWFRAEKGHDPNVIRKSMERRFRDVKIVDEIIALDQQWRKIRYELDSLKKEWNDIGDEIKVKKKANKQDPCAQQIGRKTENEGKQQVVQQNEKQMLQKIDKMINLVGNLVHESVPVSNNEEHNQVVRKWGQIPDIKITDKRGGYNHHKVLSSIGGYDPERGQKVAGHRGFFLRGPGVLLNSALVSYGLNFLHKRGYDPVQPPYFLRRDIMAETCQLSDFHEQLYKVQGDEGQEYYLIATSQQPISAMHRGEWIEEKDLPIKYAGSSSCFRKEAGAHGRQTWGIYRVHQFQKIEQFVITKPEDSWETLEKMIAVSEEFMQSLGLPYRVITIVSGALNDAAAKKYDLQAWFPGYGEYKELVSCSNCTDYQARNLEIRCGTKKAGEKEKKYVHMLNGTLCATERTLCCILENYQTETGLKVPEVLQPYVGTDFIPYKAEEKKEEKAKDKKKENKPKEKKEEKPKQKKEEKKQEKTEDKKEEVKAEQVPKAEQEKPSQ